MDSKAIAQDSFRLGMFRGVPRHLIPDEGAYDLLNLLLDDEDGSPYKRGGSSYLSAVSGDTEGAKGIWDGRTVAGDRTLIVDTENEIWLLSANDATMASLTMAYSGGGGAPLLFGSGAPKFTEHDGIVAISGDAASLNTAIYAGSRKTGPYFTGTITATQGSKTVTGAGTAWLANVDVGMIINQAANNRWNVVESVDSDTQITLRYPWAAPGGAGMAYTLLPAIAEGQHIGQEFIAGRQFGIRSAKRNRVGFTGLQATGESDFGLFGSTDYHGFPGEVLGIHGLRDMALVFTSAGVFAVRNVALDLTDAAGNVQQTVEKVDGMVLWAAAGVQAWQNALVVPARDGVYLVDGVSRPVLLSRSVSELYRSYVQAGYRPGQAFVFRNTYCLPILDSSSAVQGWLTCKMDGGDGGFWPWTRLSAGVACATVRNRVDAEPKPLGGSSASGARLTLLSWFDPSSAYVGDEQHSGDADGTPITFTLETRDYPTGTGQENTVRKARVRYELVDSASYDPALTFSYADEDGAFTAHGDTAAEANPGVKTWLFSKKGRYVRFKLSCPTAAASASIRSIEAWVRGQNRD